MLLEISVFLLALLMLLWVFNAHNDLVDAIKRPRIKNRLPNYPSVSVIRPIKGMDHGARENIKAALDNGYPGKVETIFVFDDNQEPAYPIVVEEIANIHRLNSNMDAKIVFSGNPPKGRTGKLNAMIEGFKHAKFDLIAFADSDIRPDKDILRILAETLLSNKDAGSAFTPVYASEEMKTFGDVGYSLMLNGMYSPDVEKIALKNSNRFEFIMGQYMLFKRQTIDAIGGLAAAEGQLVDDMYIGKRVYDAGYENIIAPKSVPIIQQNVTPKEFWDIYVKWMTFSRTGLGWSFKISNAVRGITFFGALVLSVLSAANGWLLASMATLSVPFAISYSTNSLHELLGGAPIKLRHLWVSFMLWLSAPFVLLSVLSRRKVVWRGRTYELGADSRLARPITIQPATSNGFTAGEISPTAATKSPDIKDKTL